jgi:hypothetical protein
LAGVRFFPKATLTLAAIAAALTVAAPAAMAKKFQYQGPIALAKQPGPFRSYTPTIQLKVQFEGKTPQSVALVKQFGVYGTCSDGTGFDGESRESFRGIKVKNGRFSRTASENESEFGNSFTVTGRIPRKGPITGTARIFFHVDAHSSPGFDYPAKDCDSGVLAWTASRTARLSDISEL